MFILKLILMLFYQETKLNKDTAYCTYKKHHYINALFKECIIFFILRERSLNLHLKSQDLSN